MTEVFNNAIDSIQLGIEDFQSNDDRRPISALRNFYAGVLLLGKECLLQAAPSVDPMEVLASRFVPGLDDAGNLVYSAKGQQTIDLYELQERFKTFGLEGPQGNIAQLQKLRNAFEHYHSNAPKQTIRQAIAACFPLIEGFFEILGKSPKEELGAAWDVMIAENSFFMHLKKSCDDTFAHIAWWPEIADRDEISCPQCRSSLICQVDAENVEPTDIEGRCKACAAELTAEKTVEVLVEAGFGGDSYELVKDGGEPNIHDCLECGNNTYFHVGGVNECFFCGFHVRGECARCGDALTITNVSWDNHDLCDYCNHMTSKDD